MTTKVLYDTDIGIDIDDAVALAYLLAEPACELLGITTVSGQAVARAQLASVLCRAAGKAIPIFPGTEAPLWGPQWSASAPQASALGHWPHQVDFPAGEAIAFLRQTILDHPGEITLLATGPLTNIALLFASDARLLLMLKSLVIMGGAFSPSEQALTPAEWNIGCDPVAAALVFGTTLPQRRSLGLDVTKRVTMAATEVRARFTHPILLPVRDFAEVWFRDRDAIIFHDPLAAVSIFQPDVCTYAQGKVTVTVEEVERRGQTTWQPDPQGPDEIALTVAPDTFFMRYFGAFTTAVHGA